MATRSAAPPARSGPRRRTQQQVKGDDAEARAAACLVAGGCVVVAVNVVIAHAELDLVVKDGDVVVFVEVKKRKTRLEALESVSASKQQKLIRGASAWLARHAPTARARFDVVAVTRTEVFHVRDAFSA